MDVPLLGLGFFVGWIALLVSSDVFGILRVSPGKVTRVQSGVLIAAIAAAIGCGYLYAQERRQAPCHGRTRASATPRHVTASRVIQETRA
jgi:hypothetical protein